jgi:hypothetical protein
MKKLKRLGIGLGLILIGMSGTVQAQTIYNSLWSTDMSRALIEAYDINRRQLEQPPPAPEPPAHPGSTSHDFDGNGVSDLAWHNSATGEVVIWFLAADGTGQAVTIASGIPPETIKATADFNGDGRTDFLRHDSTTGELAMWLMAADGTAQDVPITIGTDKVMLSQGWHFQITGDFNGDGLPDILWRSSCGEGAIWFMNGATIIGTATITAVPLEWQVVPGTMVDPLDCPSG